MPYTHFWHHYVQQHADSSGSTLTIDPAMAFAVAVCLFLVACWAAYQIQSRCGSCGAIPARCHCRPVRDREPL